MMVRGREVHVMAMALVPHLELPSCPRLGQSVLKNTTIPCNVEVLLDVVRAGTLESEVHKVSRCMLINACQELNSDAACVEFRSIERATAGKPYRTTVHHGLSVDINIYIIC